MVLKKKPTWTPKPKEEKMPHNIPDPPPPQPEPETERPVNVVSTKPQPEPSAEEEAIRNIKRAIELLDDVKSNQSILAIGKLKGALQKLGLEL